MKQMSMDNDLTALTLTQAQQLLASGELEHGHLARACYRQIERLDSRLKAFITVLPLQENQAGTASRGPLSGILIALKDLFETAGVRTTGGSRFFEDYHPEQDAHVVALVKGAGASILGKTSTHEIALGVTNINPHYGTPRNPWDIARITGGSSGGSAAAVASGMCTAALGTDTGGSIRIPASLCGVVGLKPTYGRVSLRGVLPLSWNLDHAGPLTRSVPDAAHLLNVLAGYDPHDPASMDVPVEDYTAGLEAEVSGLKIGLVSGDFMQGTQPEVNAAVRAAADLIAGLGAGLQGVPLDWLHEAARVNGLLTQADGAAVHHQRLESQPELFGADVRKRLEAGRARGSTEYALARRTQVEMQRRCRGIFQEYDALLLPSTPIVAPPIEAISDSAGQAPTLTRFTAPFNLVGAPALSLPCGFTQEGLPIGLQIVCAPWQEGLLLRIGTAYEGASDWHERRPPITNE